VKEFVSSHEGLANILGSQWGLFRCFRSGRTTSLLKELVKLTPIPKWQTRMLLRYGDIDFQSSKRAKPKARVWKWERENSYPTPSLMHEDTRGGESGTNFPINAP